MKFQSVSCISTKLPADPCQCRRSGERVSELLRVPVSYGNCFGPYENPKMQRFALRSAFPWKYFVIVHPACKTTGNVETVVAQCVLQRAFAFSLLPIPRQCNWVHFRRKRLEIVGLGFGLRAVKLSCHLLIIIKKA